MQGQLNSISQVVCVEGRGGLGVAWRGVRVEKVGVWEWVDVWEDGRC